MKTFFVSCPETELERLVHATAVTASGFYDKNGFVILPKIEPSCPEVTIVIPDLEYKSIPYFWQRVQVLPAQFPMAIPYDLQISLKRLVGKSEGVGEPRLSKWKKMDQQQ